VPAPPGDQPGHIIAGDFGDQLILAEELDQLVEFAPGIAGTIADMMLADLLLIAPGHVIESQ
jgi:hypothetical protein